MKKASKKGLGFIPSKYSTGKSKPKQAPEVKLAQKVAKRATELTKKELKPKEIKKTTITYPKGLYKSTLTKNYRKAAREVGLDINTQKPKTKKTVRKTAPKKKK